VFGRAGILLADREVSGSPESSSTVADELLLWGAGVDIAVYRGWSVRFGYENLEEMRRTVQSGPIRHERFAVGVTYDF
jgi:opacity protein-like surface antigen